MKIVFTSIIEEEIIAYLDAHPNQNLIIERTIDGRFNILSME